VIKKLTITNHLGDSLVLELTRPEKSGFVVKSIEGLGPVKANINMSSFATCDGAMYNSAFMDTRDIMISLLYYQTKDETIEDLRQKSYKYFPNKQKIRLLIETENRLVWTEGYVEDNSPSIFSQTSGCTISIRCPDPYLYSTDEVNTIFYGVEPRFEFPLENNSIEDPLLELGTIIKKTTETVFYEGDCETGCTITIDAVGPISDIAIYRVGTLETMVIDTNKITSIVGSGLDKGDTITIETSVGKKSIYLTRDGVQYNILNCLSKDSTWFTLSRGDNVFSYIVGSGHDYVRFRIANKIVYSGV
jgi:hypothetical protein